MANKILYIKASPRRERSHSISVADAFLSSYLKENPDDQINTLNLFERELPPLNQEVIGAKYSILHGQKPSEKDYTVWWAVEEIIEDFKSADKYLLAVPMWNFHLPYVLKHYIDILLQPTYTFCFSNEEGHKGLVTGKPVFIVYSRGGEYPVGNTAESYDFQTKYLEFILGFIGFNDIRSLIIEPTLAAGPQVAQKKREIAMSLAEELAREF